MFGVSDGVVVTGNGVDLGLQGEFLRFNFVAHRSDGVVLGADKGNTVLFKALREFLILGEKTVAGMDCFGTGLLAGSNDVVNLQVRVFRCRWPNADGFVRTQYMQGILVCFRVYGDGSDAHAAGGFDDAAGDFTAIGDQNFLEHFLTSFNEAIPLGGRIRRNHG